MMRGNHAVLIALLLVLTGCGASDGKAGEAGNDDPPSSVTNHEVDHPRLGIMTITPARAGPGERVALTFPADYLRGVAFTLSRSSEQGWAIAYHLTSDWGEPDSHTAQWWSEVSSEDRGWPDVGIVGKGPDHVIVPESAPVGEYLLCTANAVDQACARLTVTG